MSAKLRDLDRDVRRMHVAHPARAKARAASVAKTSRRRSSSTVRSMVVDFGEPATFGAGAHAMSVEPAMTVTDVAWENAISDALAQRDHDSDGEFRAAPFGVDAFAGDKLVVGGDEDEDGGSDDFEDIEDIQDHDEEEAAQREQEEEESGGAVLAQSDRRAILDHDDRFWSVARAADAARTQLVNDPGLADLHGPDDPEAEADDELRRDLEQLKQPHVEAPAAATNAPVTAHSIFDSMTMATTFDVGTVNVTRTFDALDAELDRAEHVRARKAARSIQAALPAPLAVDDTVEDLAWIQQAIENNAAAEEQPQIPPPPIEPPMDPMTEPERSAP